MSKAVISKSLLTGIGDAIRAKDHTSNLYTPAQMASAIGSLPVGSDQLPDFLAGSLNSISYAGTKLAKHVFHSRKGTQKSGSTTSYNPISVSVPNVTDIDDYAFAEACISDITFPALVQLNGDHVFDKLYLKDVGVVTLSFPALTRIGSGSSPYGANGSAYIFSDHCSAYLANSALLVSMPELLHCYGSGFAGMESSGITSNTTIIVSATDNTAPTASANGTIKFYLPKIRILPKYAFYRCQGLTSIDSLSQLGGIGTYALNGTYITSVNLPNLQYSDNQGFAGMGKLVTLTLPMLTKVPQQMCFGDALLETVTLGAITQIANGAFQNCRALTALIIDCGDEAAIPTLAATTAFTNTPIASGTGYIYITDSKVDELKAATNWATYAAQIKPLSEYSAS